MSFDLKPLKILIERHSSHKDKYIINFRGINLVIYPGILNPNYTKVSGFLSDNINIKHGSKVLDMFCGSGAIGILHSKNAESVLETDISTEASDCTQENIKLLDLKNVYSRISDIWENIEDKEKFDVIIANPPLLPISPNTDFEKNFADSKNMDITKRFIEGCPKHLNKNGLAYIATSTASNISQDRQQDGDIAIKTALSLGMKARVIAELNVGYEIYRVVELSI